MKKRLLAVVAMAAMLVTMIPLTVFAGSAWDGTTTDTSWYNESQTVFELSDAADLAGLATLVNGGNTFAGKTIKLANDIDLSNKEWTPIGNSNSSKQFKGTFDGQNHIIKNLSINNATTSHQGLFGYIRGNGMADGNLVNVKDLTIDGVNIVAPNYRYIGSLAGQAYTSVIENVHVKNATLDAERYVGGIVGHVYMRAENCSFEGTVDSWDASGGIAGAGDLRAYDCKVVGNITSDNWVGGIIGNGQEGTSAVRCYVKGTITANDNYYRGVGGIAGVAGHGYNGSVFENNYFDGEVYLKDEKIPAMIIGFVNADNNGKIKTKVEGNSWNTDYYSADTPVYVGAPISSVASLTEWMDAANQSMTRERNNNLVVLPSDLEFIDAEDADDVTIMQFSDITEEDVEKAIIINNHECDSNKLVNKADATCDAEGYTGDKVCSVCGETQERGTVIAKLAHKYTSGKCELCGTTDPAVDKVADTGDYSNMTAPIVFGGLALIAMVAVFTMRRKYN